MVTAGTLASEPDVVSPGSLQLQLRNNSRSLSLWQNLDVVLASGLLTKLPQKEIIMQEVSRLLSEPKTSRNAKRLARLFGL